jgi:hypothetical protein
VASVDKGPTLPPVAIVSDKDGHAAAAMYVFMPGDWQFSLALNETEDPLATVDMAVG